jgi:hypothetical protein
MREVLVRLRPEKLSVGLEPAAASLPSRNETRTKGIRGGRVRARTPALVFPQCSLDGWVSAAERGPANPYASRFEDDDGARFEFVGDCVGREERREVGVGGDEDPVFRGRAVEDLLVGC